jgi:ABC-2 type transport system ATP-binding protein
MLKVKDLSVFEHGNNVLTDVSFELKRGEAVAVIGPNYSGKSTLLRALAGGFRHVEGDSKISSYALSRDPKHYKSQLGYSAAINQPEEYLTPLEWLEIIGSAYDLAPKKRIAAILELAEYLDAKEELYRPIEQISLATRQKVSLIASLFHQPTVALWDEPTQFLDPIGQDSLEEIARQYVADGG